MRDGIAALSMIVAASCMASGASAQNLENGETVFKKCRACHMIGPEAANRVGPSLNGVIGRRAGTVDAYNYSDANKAAGSDGLIWTEEVLFKYLEKPLAFMPKTKMAFPGLNEEQDRRDIIAYLKKFSN